MSTNSKESNGHNSNTPNLPTNSNSMSIDNDASNPNDTSNANDPLMTHIIEHLRSKGLDTIANELQTQTESKMSEEPNDSNSNNNTDNSHNKNGHLKRKRSFFEMNGNQTNDSFLSQIYNNFESKSNTNTNNFVSDEQVMSSQDFSLQSFGEYSQLFEKSNKSQISCISFSNNGLFNCIGCCDGTIRIFDVNKLHQSRNFNSLIKKYDSNSYSDVHRPLISTLNSGFINDGSLRLRINEISFHPNLQSTPQLCCCYLGGIHFYEFNKQSRKSPTKTINECFNVRTVQYHPSGTYIIAAGDSCYVRIYDIEAEQGYIANKNDTSDYNINQVRYSLPGGNIFASCNQNGDIRLYDGRSLCVVNTMHKAHKGKSISSIRFSKNCKYLLSYGDDNMIRLCDLRVGKECMNYRNKQTSKKNKEYVKDDENKHNKNIKNDNNNMLQNGQACFTYNDEHILCYSHISNRIFVYDTNTGHRISKFKDHISSNNENHITYLATSPTEPAFMCASSHDNKNRFYATIKQMVDIHNNTNSSNTLQSVTNHNDDK